MENEVWRIESRMQELGSDLNHLSRDTDRRVWGLEIKIVYVYLVMFAALALLFILMMHLYENAMFEARRGVATSQVAPTSTQTRQAANAPNRLR